MQTFADSAKFPWPIEATLAAAFAEWVCLDGDPQYALEYALVHTPRPDTVRHGLLIIPTDEGAIHPAAAGSNVCTQKRAFRT